MLFCLLYLFCCTVRLVPILKNLLATLVGVHGFFFYSNILKILPPENEIFQIKNSNIFHVSARTIDYGYALEPPRRGGSDEYPQSMFGAEIRKNNAYPCKPQFYYIKEGFKGVKII